MTEPASKALGLFHDFAPFALHAKDGSPWCLPVLRTEAALRLKEDHLLKVGSMYDEGVVPPVALCEEPEKKALEAHGYEACGTWLEAYRFAARLLSEEQRDEIFFLRANDRLFRPKVQLQDCRFEGTIFDNSLCAVDCHDVLAPHSRTLLIASTAS